MIEKKIHYCWFGKGEMKPLMKKCLKSWKKYCPDYEIIEWNEDNFDVNSTLWTKQAYEAKKYAFVADYVRLKVLYEYGGVYFDTDQELIKPIASFVNHKAFLGFIDNTDISCGVMGAEKHNSIIKEFLDSYENKSFIQGDVIDTKPNTDIFTQILVRNGLDQNGEYQVVSDIHIYPRTYFCPTSCVDPTNYVSDKTVSIHHWAMTWRKESEKKTFARVKRHQTKWYRTLEKLRYLPNKAVRKIFGDERIDSLKKKLKK